MTNSAVGVAVVLLVLASGCGSIPPDQRDGVRAEMQARATAFLSDFQNSYPELEAELADAEGYIIAWLTTGMAGIARGVGGEGILVDARTGSHTYLRIGRFDLGLGVGAADFEELVLLEDRETVERFQRGRWLFRESAWSAAGENHAVALPAESSMQRYTLTRSGAAATASAGVIRISVNKDLTDTGISEQSVPIGGMVAEGRQANAPRVWRYPLPFLAQKVVDRGIDLPIPFGIGLALTDIDQDIVIDGLSAGFNGGDQQEFPFVSFGESKTSTQSAQLKLDAWILPFVNVFGLVGKVEGDAAVDVLIDGNRWLEEIGSNCDRFIPPLECLVLRDREFLLPVPANIDVTTYGVGTVLAGGWNGWFGTVPMTATWAKGDNSTYDGTTFTVTPRVGRLFNIGRLGNMAAFVGGNWLRNELTVDGVFRVPGTELDINYTIDQSNADRWNGVAGFNWDFSRRVSWSFEYNGFFGSREALITTFNVRI